MKLCFSYWRDVRQFGQERRYPGWYRRLYLWQRWQVPLWTIPQGGEAKFTKKPTPPEWKTYSESWVQIYLYLPPSCEKKSTSRRSNKIIFMNVLNEVQETLEKYSFLDFQKYFYSSLDLFQKSPSSLIWSYFYFLLLHPNLSNLFSF